MNAKKVPAKKAATKKVAAKKAAVKQAPAKKVAAKKAEKPAPKAPAKKTPKTPPAKPVKPSKPKAERSTAPIDPGREKKNGVLHPAPRTIGGDLWAICDKLTEKLGRAPARFEYREKVEAANVKRIEKGEKPYDHNSVSFQYFAWRKFHGVPARANNIFPKRGSFEVSTNKEDKAKPKAEKPAPAKKAAAKPAKAPVKAPAKPAAKKAAPAKKAAKKAAPAKKTAPKAAAPEAPPAPPSEVPGVSSRLAGVSEAAATPEA